MGTGRSEWVRGRCLGRGSTATVHLAACTASGEREFCFAVKSAELSRSAPLHRERKILSSLCSPHVVSCLGSDVTAESDGRVLYNLFIEYVSGGSLADAIKQHGGLGEDTIRVYTRGILDGLAYLHSRGMVHCDVKSQNILLAGEDGESVKLADFGCARWVDDGSEGSVVISGTPLYMAPEVARGEEQGPAADIWALGCTIIEMATGCSPWSDVADPVAAIHRIAFSGDVPEFPCNISDDARDFLDRCLKRDPWKRWSAEELLNHRFVNCGEEFTTGRIKDSKRSSPKSTLDQEFWDSWQDEEEEEEEEDEAKPHMGSEPLESAQERLWHLVRRRVPPPPPATATWEENCWITIRSGAPSEGQQPSTSESYSVKEDVGAVAGDEGWACCGDGNVASMEASLPSSNPTLNFYISGDVTNDSCNVSLLHERDALANACTFGNYIAKCKRLTNSFDYDTCDGQHFLQGTI